MRIGSRELGPGRTPYVIAEVGVNHDGSITRALELVDAAAAAGADAVKLQVFGAGLLVSSVATLAGYQARAGERDPTSMLRRLELSERALVKLAGRIHDVGLHAIATVFSPELVRPMASLATDAGRPAWDAFKVASPDVTNLPLFRELARTHRPMLVSTGASELWEVRRAERWLRSAITTGEAERRVAFMQCCSSYPARDEDAQIAGLLPIAAATGLRVGYSDHTPGEDTGVLAVELGACVLEKHLTHDRAAAGPDHAASLGPDGFAQYCKLAHAGPAADPADLGELLDDALLTRDPRLGDGQKRVTPAEREVRAKSRQSLVLRGVVRAGERVPRELISTARPGSGLSPAMIDAVSGAIAARDIRPSELLTPGDFDPPIEDTGKVGPRGAPLP